MKYFTIVCGFNEEENITISENELTKALSIFMDANGRAIFENGAIRGQDIKRIVPNWHKAIGWNKGWKMTPDDFSEVKHLEKSYNEIYYLASKVAELATTTNRPELLTKPLSEAITFLSIRNNALSEGVKILADKMKI